MNANEVVGLIKTELNKRDTEIKQILDAYNKIFGWVTVYYDEFFSKQDRELPWAMIARILHEETGNYYFGIGSSHLSKIDIKEGFDEFMQRHQAGFDAWGKFIEENS